MIALVDEQRDALGAGRGEVVEGRAQRWRHGHADAEGAVDDLTLQVAGDHWQAARGGGAQQIVAGARVGGTGRRAARWRAGQGAKPGSTVTVKPCS
ncbi:MAG: hypothetical protein R2692_03860 [Microbacterium sp.]